MANRCFDGLLQQSPSNTLWPVMPSCIDKNRSHRDCFARRQAASGAVVPGTQARRNAAYGQKTGHRLGCDACPVPGTAPARMDRFDVMR
jgi:hypothetical protein